MTIDVERRASSGTKEKQQRREKKAFKLVLEEVIRARNERAEELHCTEDFACSLVMLRGQRRKENLIFFRPLLDSYLCVCGDMYSVLINPQQPARSSHMENVLFGLMCPREFHEKNGCLIHLRINHIPHVYRH